MSPHEIMILNACYKCSSPSVNVLPHIWNSSAAIETRRRFVELGLIDPETHKATAKGEQHIERLCAVGLAHNTPALTEPVAYQWKRSPEDALWYAVPDGASAEFASLGYVMRPLYTADALQEAFDRADRAKRELEHVNKERHRHAQRRAENYARAVDAEAALADARKVIEPFAAWFVPDDTTTCGYRFGIEPNYADWVAARQWLSANQKETEG